MSSKCPPSAVARVRIGHSRASTYLSGQACEILLDILSAAPTTNMCSIGEPCVRAQDVLSRALARANKQREAEIKYRKPEKIHKNYTFVLTCQIPTFGHLDTRTRRRVLRTKNHFLIRLILLEAGSKLST